ncbi:MAG: hypothetical protein D6796_07350, partial [Caldilineae bacterium]
LNPLALADTATERDAITTFGATYLNSNPRRIKRLLNTYRYIKILATRQGERTDRPDWQQKMIHWLGLTMHWPRAMGRAVRAGRLPTPDDKPYLQKLTAGLPADQCPPPEAFALSLPTPDELPRFAALADNFIVESPRQVFAPEPETSAPGVSPPAGNP